MDTLPQLTASLEAIADECEPADAERAAVRALNSRRSARRRLVLAFGGGLAAAAVSAAALAGAGLSPGSNQSDRPGTTVAGGAPTGTEGSDSIPLLVEPGTPCAGAAESTLSSLLATTKTPVFLPGGGGPEITGVWLCAGETPALTFQEGTVYYESGWSGVDVEQKWADLIRDYGGSVATIAGRPALVQPTTGNTIKSQVMIVVDDTLVRVLGTDGAPAEPLVKIANSLEIPKPVGN